MIPYLLAVVGGYLVAQSRKSETFADGGVATESMVVTFGKHSGKTIDEIFETDRGWVKWFVEKYKTEPFIDFKGNSRMPKLTEQDIAMKEQARELLAKNPEKTRDKSVSNYIGRIGDRVTILATVVHIGPSTIFFKDERGNVFYIYDKSFDVSGKEGEMFKVTGTVTKQWDKAGEKVTYLNRAKVEKYKKPADWMYMKDGGSVGDPRFTFKTFDEYDDAKRGGYFDFNTVEVDAVDEKGMERFFQPKSEEEYLKIITDSRYKIIQETPVDLYFDIQEYYDPEDPEEREYDYEYQDEYKKGGKVGVTRASSLKRKFVWVQEQGAKGGSWSTTGVFGQKGFEEIFKEISDDKELKLVVDEESVKTFERKADGYRITFKLKAVYAKGGKVKKRAKFADKVDSIADRLDGQKVPKKLQKDYGKRYNRVEAEEAGRRIAGAQLKKLKEKSS